MEINIEKSKYSLQSKEELALLKRQFQQNIIGIPKDNNPEESRVPLTPEGVETLVKLGYKILIENEAGLKAGYTNNDYIKSGAKITYDKNEIFQNASIIIKVGPLTRRELEALNKNRIIISALNLTTQRKENFEILMAKKTTAIAYEYYTDEDGFNPFLQVIGEIIGSMSIMIAAELLSNSTETGKGIMLGGITGVPPANVVIFGTDISARQAIRTALGLGANVKVFEKSIKKLSEIRHIFGNHIYTSTINTIEIEKALKEADVLINSMKRSPNETFIITEEMVKQMPHYSIIIDLKIDAGTIIETSRITSFKEPYYIKHNILHYCIPNLASKIPMTTSIALNNVLVPILRRIYEVGGFEMYIRINKSLRNSTYIYKGVLTNEDISKLFSLRSTSIEFFFDL